MKGPDRHRAAALPSPRRGHSRTPAQPSALDLDGRRAQDPLGGFGAKDARSSSATQLSGGKSRDAPRVVLNDDAQHGSQEETNDEAR
jgi:hypothetical protein